MKKYIMLGVLTFAWVFNINAQVTIKPSVGLTFTDFSKDSYGTAKANVGTQLGGSIAFGKKFYFEPGIFWVGKSTEVTSNSTNPNLNVDMKGIRIPVAIGINLLGNEKSIFSLRGFGGASAFIVTSNAGIPSSYEVKNASFGAFAGAGIDIWKLFIDYSYEWSASNIQTNVSQINFGQTRTMYVNAGLRINL